MGPNGPPLARTSEPALSIASRQCASAWPTGPSPGTVIRLDDDKVFAGRIRRLGSPARPDLPTYLCKTQHRYETGMSLFIIRVKS